MSVLTTGAFWAAAIERAVKTAAQGTLAVLATNVTGITDVDWSQLGSIVGLAALVSVLTSIASIGVGNAGPSLSAEVLTPPAAPVPADPPPPPPAA
jgi:hypothetical protein